MELWWVDWGRGLSQCVCWLLCGEGKIPDPLKSFFAFLCWVYGFEQHSKQPNHLELWDGPTAPSCREFVHGLRGWAGLLWPGYLRFVKGQEEHTPWQPPWLCLQQSRRPSRDLWEIQPLREGENGQENSGPGLQSAVKYLGYKRQSDFGVLTLLLSLLGS